MMRLVFFLSFITWALFTGIVNAQLQQSNFLLTDLNGLPLDLSKYSGVYGTPLYWQGWMPGVIASKNGDYKMDSLNIDLLENKLLFVKNNKAFSVEIPIDSLTIIEGGVKRKYVKGLKNIPGATEQVFFEELATGKITFLKRKEKITRESNSYGAATSNKTISDLYSYYLVNSNAVTKIKINKNSLIKALEDPYKQQAEKYIQDKNMKIKDENDIIDVVNFCNSL